MSQFQRPTLRPRSGVAGMDLVNVKKVGAQHPWLPINTLPAPGLADLVNVKRVGTQRPWLPIRTLPAQGLADLAELGDTQAGTAAYGEFVNALKTYIFSKAGAGILGTANATSGLGNLINLAGIIFEQGTNGTLQPDAQAAWNRWAAEASPINSDANMAWMFGRMVSMNRGALAQAAQAAEASGLFNDLSSSASFTLMDTTQTGTTWYGGSSVASKLSNQQWSTLFVSAWTVIQKGVFGGVLPFTYLNVLVKGFINTAPTLRRFPVWVPPGNNTATDPGAIAFRTMLKQLGWSGITQMWFSFTQQAWVQSNAAAEAMDDAYSAVITGLSYISGAKVMDQVNAKVADFFEQRRIAAGSIAAFNALANGPLAASVSAEDKVAMDKIQREYTAADAKAYEALNTVGLWPAGTVAGTVNGLGAATLIISGVIAVTTLGIIAYIAATMTEIGRKGASQANKTADTVLASIDLLKQGCARTYAASGKSPSDEAAYSACVQKATDLVSKVPKPPTGSDDIFGFKGMAMAVAAVGGLALILMMRGKKAPTSFKVVADD